MPPEIKNYSVLLFGAGLGVFAGSDFGRGGGRRGIRFRHRQVSVPDEGVAGASFFAPSLYLSLR